MAFLIGFCLAPLGCWLLAARTLRRGRIVGCVLTAAVFLQIALSERWFLDDLRFTLLIPLTYLIPVGVVAAVVSEGRQPEVRPLRRSGARGIAGLVTVATYATLAGLVLAAGALMLLTAGPPFPIPTKADMMPLPAGLIATQGSEWCGNGAFATCSASVEVRGDPPASGTADVASRLRALVVARGWPLTQQSPTYWSGCRDEGLLLDRHEVCAEVFETDAAHATVALEMTAGS